MAEQIGVAVGWGLCGGAGPFAIPNPRMRTGPA